MKRYLRELRLYTKLAAWMIVMLALGVVGIAGLFGFVGSLFSPHDFGVWWQFLLISILSFWAMFTFDFIVDGRGRT